MSEPHRHDFNSGKKSDVFQVKSSSTAFKRFSLLVFNSTHNSIIHLWVFVFKLSTVKSRTIDATGLITFSRVSCVGTACRNSVSYRLRKLS